MEYDSKHIQEGKRSDTGARHRFCNFGRGSGGVGVVGGITMSTLGTEKAELFSSDTAATDFSINSYDTQVQGRDKVSVDATLKNTDSSQSHSADVTVELINATTGNVVANATKSIGSVASGDTVSLSYSFTQTDLAEQYDETVITVDQTA